jgi:hypothetical protein
MDRKEVAELDKNLLPLVVSSRPTCDKVGIMLHLFLDDGSRPYRSDSGIQGYLNIDQAKDVVRTLNLMIRISEDEFR